MAERSLLFTFLLLLLRNSPTNKHKYMKKKKKQWPLYGLHCVYMTVFSARSKDVIRAESLQRSIFISHFPQRDIRQMIYMFSLEFITSTKKTSTTHKHANGNQPTCVFQDTEQAAYARYIQRHSSDCQLLLSTHSETCYVDVDGLGAVDKRYGTCEVRQGEQQ